jgi:hypothetical protein
MMKVWALSFYTTSIDLVGIYTTEEKVKAAIVKDARKRRIFVDDPMPTNHGRDYILAEGHDCTYEATQFELDPDDLIEPPEFKGPGYYDKNEPIIKRDGPLFDKKVWDKDRFKFDE